MPNKTDLSSQLTIPETGKEVPWETRGIFSDHYLRIWLKKTDVWPSDASVEPSFSLCRELIERNSYRLSRFGNEDITRKEFIDPILRILNFQFIPETKTPGSRNTPDYLLFYDKESKDNALDISSNLRYASAISLCEAKKYGHPLGSVSKEETPGRFPHNQIRDYLQNAYDEPARKAYFNWAILTNGSEWRLYNRDAQTTSYLSIDLEDAVLTQEKFKFFWVLFNANSFVKDSEGQCILDKLRSQSLVHQSDLERDLRKRVYQLVEKIANGFYKLKKNKIKPTDITELYNTCLIFLYRLLFILYAEGRGLLPVQTYGFGTTKDYRERFSLFRLRERIRNSLNAEYDLAYTRLYNEIDELFTLINGDDESMNEVCGIPRYNGGLFDPERTEGFRKKWKIGDASLTEILRGLIYTPLPSNDNETIEVSYGEYIDYSDLEVRQLGSIYEGLLEYHLVLNQANRFNLKFGNGERKDTGSYYTPDYVVKYITARTLKPLIDEIENLAAVKFAIANGIKDNSFANNVLKLKILDPSMGSGHFLVRATEYLAFEIAAHPTTSLGVPVPMPGVSHDWAEIAYWRRRVVESCIYGVDKNPLAVELAKLSLWLTCIASDQPLNFLDHHLRTGNSLVGNRVEELNRLPARDGSTAPLFLVEGLDEALRLSVDSLTLITAQVSDSVEVVKQKEALYFQQVRENLKPFRTVADIRTAFDLGAALDDGAFRELALDLLKHKAGEPSTELNSRFTDIWAQITKIQNERIPFHWDLEFPEVFHNGEVFGFDAVIGNPPYVRQESITELKDYLERYYITTSASTDLYVAFIEKGLNLLKPGGRFGMIVSNKWMRARYGEKLREFIKQYQIEKLIDFGELKVFASSSTFPLVMIAEKNPPKQRPYYVPMKGLQAEKWDKAESVETIITDFETSGFEVEEAALSVNGFALVNKNVTDVLEKMKAVGTPLGEYVEGKIYRGIVTGFNEAFVINARTREKLIKDDPASEEVIKPFVVGDDVRRYHINYRERYIIFARQGINIEEYPIIEEYLTRWKDKLTPKVNRLDEIGRAPGKYQWYELQATTGYYKEFEKPKIVWPDIAKESRFAWDDRCYYYINTCYLMPTEEIYLIGILNSKLIWSYLIRSCAVLGDPDRRGRIRLFNTYMNDVPILVINERSEQKSQLESNVNRILELNSDLKEAFTAIQKRRIRAQIDEIDREINRQVYELYGLTSAEIATVEASI